MSLMKQNVTYITPVVCRLMNAALPSVSSGGIPDELDVFLEPYLKKSVDHIVLYAPDAIGTFFVEKHPDFFGLIRNFCSCEIMINSIFPSVTPVCFASMFSGAEPAVHGIMKYEKPPLECETIFDTLSASGKKGLICTRDGSSIHRMFSEKPVEMEIWNDDRSTTDAGIQAVSSGKYDFLLIYNQDYDDEIHRSSPDSFQAVSAAKSHVDAFLKLHVACCRFYMGKSWVLAFVPDHGAHFCSVLGKGHHGTYSPEDMKVTHFFRFCSVSG